jgi:hypothetical protein
MMRFFNKRKNDLAHEENKPKRIQVQPKRPKPKQQQQQVYPQAAQKKSPPPDYNEAIKTISNVQAGPSNGGRPSQIESYRNFNGRTYAVVRTEGGTQLVPTRAPSAALFNYQYQYNS